MWPNETAEAYTGNHVGRKGARTSLKQYSLDTYSKVAGEDVIVSETNIKEPEKVGFWRGCRGLRAWHAWREVLRTWESPEVPAGAGRDSRANRRRPGYFWAVRSSIVLGGGRADHMGKETTGLRSLQRKHGPDMKGRR